MAIWGMDTATVTVDIITTPDVVGEGFEVDTEISFTDPFVFGPPVTTVPAGYEFDRNGTFCMNIFSDSIDFNDMKKHTYLLKQSKEIKLQGSLDNNFDGTFTKCLADGDLEIFNDGNTPKLKLKIETNDKVKLEFKDIPINIGP